MLNNKDSNNNGRNQEAAGDHLLTQSTETRKGDTIRMYVEA